MLKKLFERYSKKTVVLILTLSLVLAVGVTGSLAFLIAETGGLINLFRPAEFTLEVTETSVVNSDASETDMYVRCAVIVNCRDASGNVWREAPVEKTGEGVTAWDYSLSAIAKDWTLSSDGFYYYQFPLGPSDQVPLPLTVTLNEDSETRATVITGYTVTVQYIAVGVQAKPTKAVTDSWGGEIDGSGVYTPAA